MHYYGSGADLHIVANTDAAQHLRAGPDYYPVAKRRMPLTFFISGAAERNTLVNQAVIANLRSLANYDALTMIDEETPPDLRAGMNLDARQETRDL